MLAVRLTPAWGDATTTPVRVRALRAGSRLGPQLPLALTVASVALVAARVVPDVWTRPLGAEEALSALVASRPLGEALSTVVWERGGAPLHAFLAHVALALDGSAEALRALSAVFAVGCVVACFDLGRRLTGPGAGAVAAAVAASSTLLGVYGSYGRMYALFAFTAALATDLFVRATHRRTGRSALVAAIAAWLVAASHPYGILFALVEGAVALALWRGRPFRPAVPTLVVALGVIGWLVGAWRLAGRFGVGVGGAESVASPGRIWHLMVDAFASFAGGSGVWLVAFGAAAAFGLFMLATREPAFVAFALGVIFAMAGALVLGRASNAVENLSPRHFAFALPFVAAAIGAGVSAAARRRPAVLGAAVVLVALAAVIAPPGGLLDPRTADRYFATTGADAALAAPAAWVRSEVTSGDVLFPYSPVYVAALDSVQQATLVNRDEPSGVLRALDRVDPPVRRVVVAVPLGTGHASADELRRRLPGATVAVFPQWLLIAVDGPYTSDSAVVEAIGGVLEMVRSEVRAKPLRLRNFLRRSTEGLDGALRMLASEAGGAVVQSSAARPDRAELSGRHA